MLKASSSSGLACACEWSPPPPTCSRAFWCPPASHASQYGSGISRLFAAIAAISSSLRRHSASWPLASFGLRSRPMHTSSVRRSPCSSSHAPSASISSARPSGQWTRGIAAHHGDAGDTVNCVPASAGAACCFGRVASHAKPLRRSRPASAPPGRGAEARGARLGGRGVVRKDAVLDRLAWHGRRSSRCRTRSSRACVRARAPPGATAGAPRPSPSRSARWRAAPSARPPSARCARPRPSGSLSPGRTSTAPSCSSVTRSVLLMSSRSANSSWSHSRWATVRSSPSTSCQPRSASVSIGGELLEDRRRVDDGDEVVEGRDVVERDAGGLVAERERLGDGQRLGDARRLDEHVVEAALRRERRERRGAGPRAACSRCSRSRARPSSPPCAACRRCAHELRVDVDRRHVVDDHGDPPAPPGCSAGGSAASSSPRRGSPRAP